MTKTSSWRGLLFTAAATLTSLLAVTLIVAGGSFGATTHRPASHSPADPALPSGLPAGGLSPEAAAMVRAYPQALLAVRFYRPFETGDVTPYEHILTSNWDDVPRLPGQGPGRAGFSTVIAMYHKAMPNLLVHIEQVVIAGNTVVVRTTATGTQTGPLLGVAATGRRVSFRTADVYQVHDGRIIETHHLEDLFGLYEQITATTTS